ncbi:MAG: prepilin peptidase [Vallitalea sp.]|nr:prepilin peptidase [Vallitalea sp.]
MIKYILIILLLTISLYTDTKTYKIKNNVVLLFLLLGLIINYVYLGVNGIQIWFIGFIVPIIILFILFVVSMIGAGDIKLISAIGGILGIEFLINSSKYIIIVAALIAIIKMIRHKQLISRLVYFYNYILDIIITRKVSSYCELKSEDKSYILRLSYAISGGTIIQMAINIL